MLIAHMLGVAPIKRRTNVVFRNREFEPQGLHFRPCRLYVFRGNTCKCAENRERHADAKYEQHSANFHMRFFPNMLRLLLADLGLNLSIAGRQRRKIADCHKGPEPTRSGPRRPLGCYRHCLTTHIVGTHQLSGDVALEYHTGALQIAIPPP